MRQKSTIAIGLTLLLTLSVLTVGGYTTEAQATTEIAECTTITEPGSYQLTADLTHSGEDDCINVEADDVTIDGNGHSITFERTEGDPGPYGTSLAISNQANVTIHDVTLRKDAKLAVGDSTAIIIKNNELDAGLYVENSRDVTIRENTIAADTPVKGSQNVSVMNNHIDGGMFRVSGPNPANITARDNHGDGELRVTIRAGEAIIVNNSLRTIDVWAGADTYVEVARNHAGAGGIGVSSNAIARVHNNTVEGGGLGLGGTSDDFLVTHNTITDSDIGVYIAGGYDAGPAVVLERNIITDNRIGVETVSNLPEIHHNDLSGNTEYGVIYTQENGVVNATNNYWGDRPSSPEDDDAPFEDPVTEALANGTGSAVSEGTAPAGVEPGVSNIHFDPWLSSAPDAGVVEQPSNGDDTGDETTTTTTEDTTTTTTTTDDTTTTTTTTTSDDTTTTTTPSDDEESTTTTTTASDDTTTTTPPDDERGSDEGAAEETDSDSDGLTDDEEQELGTDPQDPDTDGDGVNDCRDDHPLDECET